MSEPMNLNQIQDLIKFVAKSGVSEVEIEQKDFKITIKTPAGSGYILDWATGTGTPGRRRFWSPPRGAGC